ncbi:hypothetical protein [Terriglobus sp. RCC_193]|uniref:hypothetical protein n=1 Tax=Terriglobus sp. RCC_193 TaxID=3239218 RepID=UPI0035248B9C
MASIPVAFHMEDEDEVDDEYLRTPSTRISRLCFRCDTRSPGEIFPGGFTNREFEAALLETVQETVKAVKKSTGKDIKPVMNPIGGASQESWKKPMLHPFSPGSDGAKIYEPLLAKLRMEQMPKYRNFDFPGNPAMYDIAPSTGVALTYHPQFSPLFPIGRGKEFEPDAWIYAVWVDDAVETYKRQEVDRPEIAGVQEVVVQYVPFHRVLAAVPCKRKQSGPALCPLEFTVGLEATRNPHAGPEHMTDVLAALQPLLGKHRNIVREFDGYKVKPF